MSNPAMTDAINQVNSPPPSLTTATMKVTIVRDEPTAGSTQHVSHADTQHGWTRVCPPRVPPEYQTSVPAPKRNLSQNRPIDHEPATRRRAPLARILSFGAKSFCENSVQSMICTTHWLDILEVLPDTSHSISRNLSSDSLLRSLARYQEIHREIP